MQEEAVEDAAPVVDHEALICVFVEEGESAHVAEDGSTYAKSWAQNTKN